MSYGRRLLIALLCAQLPMIVGVVLPLVGGVATSAAFGSEVTYRLISYRALLSARPYGYALIVILLYGAPLYALLAQRGYANWLTATVLGLAPGVGALLIGIYPSGRLADANVTIGPIVMACGLYVALGTHAVAREVTLAADRTARQVMRRSALPLARVFLLAAILGQAYVVMLAVNTPPGTDFAGLGLLFGPGMYVIPFLLAALACALYSHFATRKPRGIARVIETVAYLAIGAVLLYPAALLLLGLFSV
jgi:hypothetical protein